MVPAAPLTARQVEDVIVDATASKDSPARVYCPHCGRLTDHIQVFEYPVIVFAFVYFAWSGAAQRVFGCPVCVRQRLRTHALINVVTANFFCWIPLTAILMSIRESHRQQQPVIPREFAYLARAKPPDASAKAREAKARRKRLVVVVVLAILAAFLVFVLPAVSQ